MRILVLLDEHREVVAASPSRHSALVVGLLGVTSASAATPTLAETRVGASTPATVHVAGVHKCVSAGQRWGNAPPQAETTAGFCVAANGGQKWAYRGVARDHPGYDDALKGRANPRNPNGTATPEQHNLGNTTDSPYTSWTRDPDVARRFAGPDGVVLRVPRGEGSP